MYKLVRTLTIASVFTALAFAKTWSGTLIDASCTADDKTSAECAPTTATSNFALILADGKILTLDAAGNSKAADALINSADRSKTPDTKKTVKATVTGTLYENTIQVEKIEVQ